MKDLESEFERMVREHRGTIYTVCYMFSNDQDEVADLFQEVLINLWKSLPERVYLARPQEATAQDGSANDGHQSL